MLSRNILNFRSPEWPFPAFLERVTLCFDFVKSLSIT
jgi:hypothetical protein